MAYGARVPPLKKDPPLNVFVADKDNTPDPSLVKLPEPVLIIVLTVVLPLPPTVKLTLAPVIAVVDSFKVNVP